MLGASQFFTDRHDAGRQLAKVLGRNLELDRPLVLALPRGGVPVAFEVAQALGAELDLLIVRKIGAPGYPEYGIGAVVDGSHPQIVLNDDVMDLVQPSSDYVQAETERQLAEIERRRKTYLGDRPPADVTGRSVLVVDDGVATGGTVKAALLALRKSGAARIILAVPVGPREKLADLSSEADVIVWLFTPEPFRAVGLHYANFDQTSDEEVVDLLTRARSDIENGT